MSGRAVGMLHQSLAGIHNHRGYVGEQRLQRPLSLPRLDEDEPALITGQRDSVYDRLLLPQRRCRDSWRRRRRGGSGREGQRQRVYSFGAMVVEIR
jgi:hypothetical protein